MEIWKIILIIYLSGLGCTFAALALIMKSRLDRFDWYYDKNKYITILIAGSMLWFIFWFLAKNNLNSLIATDENGYAAALRLRINLPPCGELISYRPKIVDDEDAFGEFIFYASDVEDYLLRKIDDNYHLYDDDEGAILEWVRKRDAAIAEPSEVPHLWRRFKYIADELLREGFGNVHCSACGKNYKLDDLIINDDKHRPGWNRNRLYCPENHNLISFKRVHYLMRSYN
jgi:hypothetical protein